MTTLLEGLINIYKLSKELVINKLAISCTVVPCLTLQQYSWVIKNLDLFPSPSRAFIKLNQL